MTVLLTSPSKFRAPLLQIMQLPQSSEWSLPLLLLWNNDFDSEGPVVFTISTRIPAVARTLFIRVANDPISFS